MPPFLVVTLFMYMNVRNVPGEKAFIIHELQNDNQRMVNPENKVDLHLWISMSSLQYVE